jgi:hypothetical protein
MIQPAAAIHRLMTLNPFELGVPEDAPRHGMPAHDARKGLIDHASELGCVDWYLYCVTRARPQASPGNVPRDAAAAARGGSSPA